MALPVRHDEGMETTEITRQSKGRLVRPTEGRVLGGVAAAVAAHTGASVGLIRLGLLATALLGGFGIVLYLAAWALTPGDGETDTAAERWLHNLTTPGKRLGAFLIGLAGLVILAGAAPATILAAAVLLAAAALLANGQSADGQPIPAAPPIGEEE